MPTFIKTGFWEKVKRAPKEWLNLDKFVEDKINSTPSELGYKTYVALLNQSNENAPTAIVLQNTIGDITYEYVDTGLYKLNLIGAFPINKTFVTLSRSTQTAMYFVTVNQSVDYITIEINDKTGSITLNDSLVNSPLEIRVYP